LSRAKSTLHPLTRFGSFLWQTSGLADGTASPSLKLQLSSPVEEALLSAEQSTVQFADVETSQATLSVVGFHSDNASNNHHFAAFDVDVATVTHKLLNALEPAPIYQAELVIPIATHTNDSGGDETNVLCTVTLSVSYTPSAKDQMEKLYDLMEKETSAKAAAREELRRASLDLHALQGGSGNSGTIATKPAVSAGFLNKDKSKVPVPPKPSAWKVWYQRASVIVPMVKNYVFFVGFIVVSQYYGSNLAIPAPV
jgi:hypothetical protein